MKNITASLIVFCLSFGCLHAYGNSVQLKKPWDTFSIRYGSTSLNGFDKLPKFRQGLDFENFIEEKPEPGFEVKVDFYCLPNDPRVCVMFDKMRNVAGIQFSYLDSDFANVASSDFDFANNPNFVRTNFFKMPAYSFRIYFTNPETLLKIGRVDRMDLAEGVWVYLEGKLYQVPSEQREGNQFDNFYKQGCVDGMGLHYFYKISRNLPCSPLTPFFVTYENGRLVGFGMSVFGKGKGRTREWYELFSMKGVELIIPDRPQCFDTIYNKYELTTTHVYLVAYPYTIKC